jgi:hypothetical protein
VALGFIPSDAAVLIVQAGVVAAPRHPPRPAWLQRLSGPVWAIIPIASIVGVIFAIRYVSSTATGLTWLALIAVPLLAALALGWAVHGGRWWLAPLFAPLFLLAWLDRTTLVGEGAATLLCALSCVSLGWLLAAVTPPGWLKLGILAMAAADVWLVLSDLLQAPNDTLVSAAPAPGSGLPQLQSESFGSISLGYGDLFVAGLLGGVLAREGRGGRGQAAVALLTLVLAGLFDLLFLVLSELPATVPVAAALIIAEAYAWHRSRRRGRVRGRGGGAEAEAQCWSSPVDAGGRDSSASEVIASLPRAASSSTSVASSAERE